MNNSIFIISCIIILSLAQELRAEVLDRTTPQIRIRIGDNNTNNVNTVIYNAGIPDEFASVSGVVPNPQTISTNSIAGASGIYTVRIVTDLNLRNFSPATATALTGTFSYNSSTPMSCTTPASCGATVIPFDKISWTTRDGDTHTSVLQYNNSAVQIAQTQTDTNDANNATDTRHRNYFRFSFNNDTLLPAGTYEGTIEIDGEGQYTF